MTSPKEKAVLLRVVEQYKNLPHLWDPSHKDYKNKLARQEGYKLLLDIYKPVNEYATIKSTIKKLYNLRSNYFKEVAKVAKAKKAGEFYEPSLWYYNAFKFFGNNKPYPPRSENTLDTDTTLDDSPKAWSSDDEDDEHGNDFEETNESLKDPFESTIVDNSVTKIEYEDKQPTPKKRKRKYVSNSPIPEYSGIEYLDEFKDSVETLEVQSSQENEFDAYGRYVAAALKSMDVGRAWKVQLKVQTILTEAKISYMKEKSMNNSFSKH